MPLTAGQHEIKLLGIKAEDGIGIYYIQFEGDVTSVSGDALEGRDLCPDVVKEYQVNVGQVSNTLKAKVNNYMNKLQSEKSSAVCVVK